ncbi:alkaline phosphatase family protein [Candidatus Binatia bacterium]|nr:alkaline phosphatase family protein [Candidatus Binatia bacterium]
MDGPPRLLLLELNEVNFEMVDAYAACGDLPNFRRLFDTHGYCQTSSETEYKNLEPWIQWVTAHTGLTLAEHGVFRLGDIVEHQHEQIWELLESRYGIRTGAVSPMNAQNRCVDPAFFIPDPWTDTEVIATDSVKRLFSIIRLMVNENTQSKIGLRSLCELAKGLMRFGQVANYGRYLKFLMGAGKGPWRKALILDQLLADLFINETARTRPEFASIFLNAAAHVQHHYLFNSKLYKGDQKNPGWYVAANTDPVWETYKAYDSIIGDIQKKFPDTQLMIATGLHQEPYPKTTYYWRLNDHADFLRKAGVPFQSVEPRMSRDFLVSCKDVRQAKDAQRVLQSAHTDSGETLFEVDRREDSLFVMLAYPNDISHSTTWQCGEKLMGSLREDVGFVAIKNGEHSGIGYFLDNGSGRLPRDTHEPLTAVPEKMMAVFEQ